MLEWLVLNLANIPQRGLQQLLDEFGNAREILDAPAQRIEKLIGIEATYRLKSDKLKDKAQQELKKANDNNIWIMSIEDDKYPHLLKKIQNPPIVLYGKGELPDNNFSAYVSIVGSRKATATGKSISYEFGYALGKCGWCVVSGMAVGIDAAAHRGALAAGGKTIAVLGCGIDVIYPKENEALLREVSCKGVLISEFPLSTFPLPHNFPRRNRIISGLSVAVVVVEAAIRSGALLTAQWALSQGREVYAVPGSPKNKFAEGVNQLIKDGAKPITSANELLNELGHEIKLYGLTVPKRQLSKEQEKICQLLEDGAKDIEYISNQLKLDLGKTYKLLLELELMDVIVQLRGNRYQKK